MEKEDNKGLVIVVKRRVGQAGVLRIVIHQSVIVVNAQSLKFRGQEIIREGGFMVVLNLYV